MATNSRGDRHPPSVVSGGHSYWIVLVEARLLGMIQKEVRKMLLNRWFAFRRTKLLRRPWLVVRTGVHIPAEVSMPRVSVFRRRRY